MIETIIYVFLFVAVLLVSEAVYFAIRYAGEKERAQLKQRLRSLGEPGGVSLLKERRIARSASMDSFLRRFPLTERLEELLVQTELNWTVAKMMAIGLILGVGLGAVLFLLVPQMPMLSILGLALGVILPVLLALDSRSKRSKKISTQLPDALDMMSRSLQAGHGISAGFKLVATEMPAPVAVEFGRCFEEHNVGAEFKEAVTNMTFRVPGNLDLKLFAVSLVIQHETGGNLVEILSQIAYTIRERYKFYGKLRALTAEGRASALILGLLPFLFALLVTFMSPGYLVPLVKDPSGRLLLGGGFTLWVLGFVWIRSLTRLDY